MKKFVIFQHLEIFMAFFRFCRIFKRIFSSNLDAIFASNLSLTLNENKIQARYFTIEIFDGGVCILRFKSYFLIVIIGKRLYLHLVHPDLVNWPKKFDFPGLL